ncbi:hypothetical protein CRP01_39650 [Flavilitoribacter nigricans DSM 23189 = NBRC 102662]|uniref:DUF218 domain-containing protein n=1 Tax=Flavilitoribacter nigricans (strain ATCC 23147 / DSM 23189 / NBRC 102662 / NCIMB 1420 / SS-2) TaxID=1122177 RepID=A0A2D0MZR6_FLAN2|nr:hypothetical protein CRP01_39650 [Flavilitoribacter nigricans DSM 23189 = NBRC 102662]
MKEDILKNAQILWDYHNLDFALEEADFILAMGSHDERVAIHAAQLVLDGYAPLLITSGGFGKVTKKIWNTSEGKHFANIAEKMGVPREKILVEEEATNTGDNVTKSKAILASHGINVEKGILVTKPYMCRRAYATAAKQWPEIEWLVSAPELSFGDYPNSEVPLDRMINLMVGDLQRIKIYAEKGFQIPQEIPTTVWRSYEALKKAGYDTFVIEN